MIKAAGMKRFAHGMSDCVDGSFRKENIYFSEAREDFFLRFPIFGMPVHGKL